MATTEEGMPVVPALSEKPASPALPLGSPADEPDAGRAATPASYPGGGDEETGDKATKKKEPIDVHKHLAKGSLPLLFRSLTIAFTIVAFALIAELSFKELVPKSGATLTHDYNRFTILNFVLAIDVVVFFQSVAILFTDILIVTKTWEPEAVAQYVVPRLVAVTDLLLLGLLFGAATAAAGIRSTFSDLTQGAGCSLNSAACHQLTGAVVFGYLAFFVLLVSTYINIKPEHRKTGPW